uniref:Uncharacterized protein n=1 Tax=Myotis myotis TaxID=51298 RepID=A0A7J7R729_MYOMY|nr:hypothetical protein mMyoMyo1_010893 [Myotis myotis]
MEASSPVSFWLKFGVYLFEIQTPLGTRGCLCAPPWVCVSEGGRPSSSPGVLQVYSYAQSISGSVIYEREVYPTEMTFKTAPALSWRTEPFPMPAGLFLPSRSESLPPRSRRGPVPARHLGSVTPRVSWAGVSQPGLPQCQRVGPLGRKEALSGSRCGDGAFGPSLMERAWLLCNLPCR